MSDFNIYDDLELLHAQQKQKEGEELQWKEKYHVALETIQKLQVEKKELNKKIKQLEINFASLLDTARTEIKRKDNQINQLRREKDDICFRRNVRPIKKLSIDEGCKNDGGYVNPFSIDLKSTAPKSAVTLSKPVDEKNKTSTSRQRNGECEEKDNRSSYREPRPKSACERSKDRDRSRHMSREEQRRKDDRDSGHRRDRYDRTSSQARSSDSSRETTDKGQRTHSHRAGYTKDSHQTKSNKGYCSSSKYETHSKGKRDSCRERKTYKEKESKTANGRSDDGIKEKVPPIEKLAPKENTNNRKSSALEKQILNDAKELKKAKQSETENEGQSQIDAVKARTEKSNNFLDALFDDMVLNGEEEQTNDLYNDLPLETIGNDKIERKQIGPKTDENCNVEPVMQTPLKQPVTTLLDDLFGPSPANSAVSAAVGRRISLSTVGESSDAVSSDEVEFVSISTASEKDEKKKSVVVADLAIDVSSVQCSKADKPMIDKVQMKSLPKPVSEPKAFQFVELDSSFYSSDEDERTDNADVRESQSDIDSPPFEKCQLLRSDFEPLEQRIETKEMTTETHLPEGFDDKMTSVKDSRWKESVLTTAPADVKKDQCSKPSSVESPYTTEIACDPSAKNEKKKRSSQKDSHRHHHSSKHAKISYSSRSSNEKHRYRNHHHHHHHHHRHHRSSKESTISIHRSENRSPRSVGKYSKDTTNAPKEKNQKESEVKLVWSEDTEDQNPAQEKQTAAHEDTSSDLKLYHDQVIALNCDDISDEEGVEADPPKIPEAGTNDEVPRTLEDLVISLQCEDLSEEEQVQFVVETNNEVVIESEMQAGSENFVAEPFDVLNYEDGELMERNVKFANMEQAIASNNVVILLNNEETQVSVNNDEIAAIFVQEATADMNQLCQSMFPVESTKSTAAELCEIRKETTESKLSNIAFPQIESEDQPPEPTNSLPIVLSQEQPSSQDSTDVFSSGGRRKKIKTPRKNTNAGSILNHPSATNLKALIPHRWTKSDDEYDLTVTKQNDASNCHPRRRQSTSNLEEAATGSGKERILPDVTHSEEADGTVLHKPCLIVEEELQKDMSPLWVEEESTEATIGLKVSTAITTEEQSGAAVETKDRDDFPEIAPSVSKKRNREDDDDEALVTTTDIEIHKKKRIIQVPSDANVEEPEVLIVSESSTDSTAVFPSESVQNGITADAEVAHMVMDSIVMSESVVTSDSMQHVTEAGTSVVDATDTNLDVGLLTAVTECEAINNDFVQKPDNQKGIREPNVMGVNQKKDAEDEKQIPASGNSRKRRENTAPGCDKKPVVSKTPDDKKVAKDNQKEPSLKDAANSATKNKFIKEPSVPKIIFSDDQRTSKVALDSSGEEPHRASGNDSALTSNILRCVVKLPILPVFSGFDGKKSDSPLTDCQQVATSDENKTLNSTFYLSEAKPILPEGNVQTVEQKVATNDSNSKLNSKLVQDTPYSNETQDTLPLSDVQSSELPLSDEQQVATTDNSGKHNKDHFQNSTHSDGNPPTSTDSSKFDGEQLKSAPTAEPKVPTSDQTNISVPQHSTNSDANPSILPDSFDSETLQTDKQRVTTSESVLTNHDDSDGKKTSPIDVNNTAAETVTSDDKSTSRASLTLYSSDLESVRENYKINPPSDQSTNSLNSNVQPDAGNTRIKTYKKSILNSFNNSSLEAGEGDNQHSSGSQIEKLATSSNNRKRTKAVLKNSSDSAGDTTIEGVQSAVQIPSTSGNKTKQRKTNVISNGNSHPEFDNKTGQTEQLPTTKSKNSPTSGTKQKHERRHADSGKKHLTAVASSEDNKAEKVTLELSTDCDAPQAVPTDTHQMDQQKASISKRKYKKRSSLDHPHSETHRPTVVGTIDGAPIELPAKTSASPCSEDIQNPILQGIASCTSNSNLPSSNESQIQDNRESNAIYIKRKMIPSNHQNKRRKCSTSSSDTINITSDSQSMIPSANSSDIKPTTTAIEKPKLSLSTPAVTPTHHKIFNEDVYPEDQPPAEYNANGDDIQYQEIDNRMRSIFQSPTYPQTKTCVELQVDISKGDITIEETLLPGEISQCDTSSSSRKISVGSNDYVIETVGAHTANVFVTRKKCKKRTKAVKMAVS